MLKEYASPNPKGWLHTSQHLYSIILQQMEYSPSSRLMWVFLGVTRLFVLSTPGWVLFIVFFPKNGVDDDISHLAPPRPFQPPSVPMVWHLTAKNAGSLPPKKMWFNPEKWRSLEVLHFQRCGHCYEISHWWTFQTCFHPPGASGGLPWDPSLWPSRDGATSWENHRTNVGKTHGK